MIERRGFLTFMSAALTGMLLPKLPDSIVFDPGKLGAVGEMALPMAEFMREVERHFHRALAGWDLAYAPSTMFPNDGAKMGDTVHVRAWCQSRPVVLRDQLNVTLRLPEQEDLFWRARYAAPAGETLASAVKVGKIRVVSDLDMPTQPMIHACRISNNEHGTALRGVVQYDPKYGEHHLRVDLLGGC